MAPSTHCIASSLPWQYTGYRAGQVAYYHLRLSDTPHTAGDIAYIDLWYDEVDRRYRWAITPISVFTPLRRSRGPGWRNYAACERAMLLALAELLHPAG